jgi:hypothetical protein
MFQDDCFFENHPTFIALDHHTINGKKLLKRIHLAPSCGGPMKFGVHLTSARFILDRRQPVPISLSAKDLWNVYWFK